MICSSSDGLVLTYGVPEVTARHPRRCLAQRHQAMQRQSTRQLPGARGTRFLKPRVGTLRRLARADESARRESLDATPPNPVRLFADQPTGHEPKAQVACIESPSSPDDIGDLILHALDCSKRVDCRRLRSTPVEDERWSPHCESRTSVLYRV